jgi:hypothetical protein
METAFFLKSRALQGKWLLWKYLETCSVLPHFAILWKQRDLTADAIECLVFAADLELILEQICVAFIFNTG